MPTSLAPLSLRRTDRRPRARAKLLGLGVAAALMTVAPFASAQTVQQIAAQGACSTAGVVGLSDQLVQVQMCLSPGTFVPFTPHAGVSLTSSRIHAYLLATARDALWAAAGTTTLKVNSAFRTLADQYVLYHSGACGLAATPGNSNHETGRAVDLENWSAARAAMIAAGCEHPYPTDDPVHFDCPGDDHRADSILAFQRLWNVNNPGDVIDEDGLYGPITGAKLAASPAGGFATVPDCPPTPPDDAGVDAGSEAGSDAGADGAPIEDATSDASDASDDAMADAGADAMPDGAAQDGAADANDLVTSGNEAGCACTHAGSGDGATRGWAAGLGIALAIAAISGRRR